MYIKSTIPLTLVSLALASSAQAAISITQNLVSSNTNWTLNDFSSADTDPGAEKYDERTLSIKKAKNTSVESIQIILDTTGTFDDSVALDIDRDGSIDFLTGEGDALATPGISGNNKYTPWVNSSPFKLSAIITNTGTTVTAYWGGVQINVAQQAASPSPPTSPYRTGLEAEI